MKVFLERQICVLKPQHRNREHTKRIQETCDTQTCAGKNDFLRSIGDRVTSHSLPVPVQRHVGPTSIAQCSAPPPLWCHIALWQTPATA